MVAATIVVLSVAVCSVAGPRQRHDQRQSNSIKTARSFRAQPSPRNWSTPKSNAAAVTDGDGNYKIIQLAPGKYTLTAVANSFQTTVESGLEFTAGRNAQIDLILFPPGLKLDTVVITTEDASPVDVTRTVVGGTVKTREIENLPVVLALTDRFDLYDGWRGGRAFVGARPGHRSFGPHDA